MAEIVELFVEPAAFPGSYVSQPMIEGTQSLPQTIITHKELSYLDVDLPAPRAPLHDNRDTDTPATGQQEGLRQPFIPEVISHPEDFPSGWNCMNTLFQVITQATRGAIRAAPIDMKR